MNKHDFFVRRADTGKTRRMGTVFFKTGFYRRLLVIFEDLEDAGFSPVYNNFEYALYEVKDAAEEEQLHNLFIDLLD